MHWHETVKSRQGCMLLNTKTLRMILLEFAINGVYNKNSNQQIQVLYL